MIADSGSTRFIYLCDSKANLTLEWTVVDTFATPIT